MEGATESTEITENEVVRENNNTGAQILTPSVPLSKITKDVILERGMPILKQVTFHSEAPPLQKLRFVQFLERGTGDEDLIPVGTDSPNLLNTPAA